MQATAEVAQTVRQKWRDPVPPSMQHHREPAVDGRRSNGSTDLPGPGAPGRGQETRRAARRGLIDSFLIWARLSPAPLRTAPAALPTGAAVQASESAAQLLQGLFDTLHEEVALLSAQGVVIAVNAAWRGSFDHAGGSIGADYLTLCRGISPDLRTNAFRRGVQDLLDGRMATFSYDFVVQTRERMRRSRGRITPLSPAGANLFVVIHDSADAADSLAGAREELLKAQDTERQRIAMELHDSTGQHLAALGLGVMRLRRMLGGAGDEVLEEMSKSISEVMKEIRVLSFLKRPAGLQGEGLAASVPAFVKGFGVRTELDADLTIEGDLSGLPPAVEHAAFRILQETLSNVFRHAAATAVDVRISRTAGTLTVSVADDGRGIAALKDGDLSQVSLGVGIVGMQTRAAQLGGRLDISSLGVGTTVTAVFPVLAAHPTPPLGRSELAQPRAPSRRQGGAIQRELLARLRQSGHSTEMAEVLLAAFDTAVAPHHGPLRRAGGAHWERSGVT